VLNFHQPHLRATRHIPASIVTRVTPEDVLATYRLGRPLYCAPHFQTGSAATFSAASVATVASG
jgi:hypothetical protein